MTGVYAWTEQELDHAARMWADGRSSGEIGREIGKSRSSVCGMMSRNREIFPKKETPGVADGHAHRGQGRPKRVRHHLTTTTSRPIVERPPREVRRTAMAPELPQEEIVEAEADPVASQPVTFLAVTDRQCKWPLWAFPANPGGDGLCCGVRIELGDTYCSHHRSLSRGSGTRSEQTATALLQREAAR